MARQRFDQTLSCGQFQFRHTPRNFAEVRVCIRMIAYVVAFGEDAFDQTRIRLAVLADNEERSEYFLTFEDVEDLRRPLLIRTIVEGQGNLARVPSGTANDIGRWYAQILRGTDQPAG